MNSKDKIIVIFYIFLAVSYIISILYMDKSFSDIKVSQQVKTPVNEIRLVTNFTSINKTKFFDTVADVNSYPIVSPKHFVSIKIINQSKDVIYAEEQVKENIVTDKILVKHTIIPYTNQTMEVMNGDAKGTMIRASFLGNESKQTLITDVELHLRGKLAIFTFLPKQALELELNSIISDFATYSTENKNKYEKIVDDLYREILHRPSDEAGLKYFSTKLESGQMSIEDIRKSISESPEARSMIKN